MGSEDHPDSVASPRSSCRCWEACWQASLQPEQQYSSCGYLRKTGCRVLQLSVTQFHVGTTTRLSFSAVEDTESGNPVTVLQQVRLHNEETVFVSAYPGYTMTRNYSCMPVVCIAIACKTG